MLRRIKNPPILLHLVLMSIVVVAIIAIATRAQTVTAEIDDANPLLVNTRQDFKICLASVDDLDEVETHWKFSEALARLQVTHPDWEKAYAEIGMPIVESDCSFQLPDHELHRFDLVGPGLTDAPGPWRSVFIVLDDANADMLLGKKDAIFVSYETMQEGDHVFSDVTSSVVVRQSFLDDSEFLDWYLPVTVGLEPLEHRSSGEEDPNAVKQMELDQPNVSESSSDSLDHHDHDHD